LLILGHASLGDTVVALPMLREIRRASPHTEVTWVAPTTLMPLLELAGVDAFVASDASPAQALNPADFGALLTLRDADASAYSNLGALGDIPLRVGSVNGRLQRRWCNHLVHVKRLGWPRHEAQRNHRLLIPFGVDADATIAELTRLAALPPAEQTVPADLPGQGFVVLHLFSAGHAREWPIGHWISLVDTLIAAGMFVVLTGSPKESLRLAQAWPPAARPAGVFDAFGRLDLAELGGLLSRAVAVVAASTGPLHLAAALGVPSIGLFVPRKGIDASRWAPLGARAVVLQSRERCTRRCEATSCRCIDDLLPPAVAAAIERATQHARIQVARRPTRHSSTE
jgi:ADP-heptose:LPS heptosyltransferase